MFLVFELYSFYLTFDSLSLSKWFLELWYASHAVLGMIAVIFIERAIHKILISCFLSCESKHDKANRAWWTGKWYGRGLGAHALSQPAREYVVKIVELSLVVRLFPGPLPALPTSYSYVVR